MDNRHVALLIGLAAITVCGARQSHAQEARPDKLLALSDTEQIAFTNSFLDRGMPVGEDQGFLYLVRSRSSLILPIIENKIEQVLTSPNPHDCFSVKNVDPQKFVGMAAYRIADAADEQGLKETSKLLKLDEKRFGWMPESMLSHLASRNPFILAYKGTDIGNPALNRGIGRYADAMFRQRTPDHPNSLERRWADVMVDRYRGVPIQSEWATDPIVSHMTPAIVESMRRDMLRFLQVAWEKHPRRLLAMSDAEQATLAKSRLEQGIADLREQEMNEVERREFFAALARAHSSLVLPIIEAKIEEVLQSRNPIECFTNKSVVPETFLSLASVMIAQAADVEALRQAGKLQKLNRRFGGLIELTLENAFSTGGSPFIVAYRGFELGDPEVDKKIMAWVEDKLAGPALNTPRDWRHQWAEAMVDHYGAVPAAGQWRRDPIASRLKPAMSESLRSDVVRLATEVVERRIRK